MICEGLFWVAAQGLSAAYDEFRTWLEGGWYVTCRFDYMKSEALHRKEAKKKKSLGSGSHFTSAVNHIQSYHEPRTV